MPGHTQDEDTEATIERIRADLALDAARSPSTLFERTAALEDIVSMGIGGDSVPELRADIAELLQSEIESSESAAASLYGMAHASTEIRCGCARNLQPLDVDRRLETDAPLEADDRLLAALAAIVRDGNVLDPGAEIGDPFVTFPDDAPMPMQVVDALDDLLFAASETLVQRHTAALERARQSVIDRVLAPENSADLARTDARTAAILLVQSALDAPDPQRVRAVVDCLTAAPEPLVRAWGHLIVRHSEHQSEDDGLSAAVETIFEDDTPITPELAPLVARILSRAVISSANGKARQQWLRQLSEFALGLRYSQPLIGPATAELNWIIRFDALTEEDLSLLFESLYQALTSIEFGGKSGQAALVIETLNEANVLTTEFTDRILRTLVASLETDDQLDRKNTLNTFRHLFALRYDYSAPSHRGSAETASQDAMYWTLDAATDTLHHGTDEEAATAARILRDMAVQDPFVDDIIGETYDDLVETAVTSTGHALDRASLAIQHATYGGVLHSEQAERFLCEQHVHQLAQSIQSITAAEAVLSTYEVTDTFDALAFSAAIFDRVPDLGSRDLGSLSGALARVAIEHSFENSAAGVEFVSAVLDIDAHRYSSFDPFGHLTQDFGTILDGVPKPQSTDDLAPLLERIRSDDPTVRQLIIHLLSLGTPAGDELLPYSDDPDEPLVSGELVRPFVDPLVDHFRNSFPAEEPPEVTSSLLVQYAEADLLTAGQLDAVTETALSQLDHDESVVATLLQSDSVLDHLPSKEIERVFETYVSMLEPIDIDDERSLGEDGLFSPAVDEDPNGTLGVLEALLRGEHVTPSSLADALPIREFGDADAPSLTTYLTASQPSTARLRMLLGTGDVLERGNSDLVSALDRTLASGQLSEDDRFSVLELRTEVETTSDL
ncbi:hypothetical protein [Haloarchaeobius sp. DYHT-AS-18]|uniref:hypothetical protein n=1 Tax=Haloarchaeobius sp. DYHT-AS-18 TaxID=3446117 RepID=UPI003EBD6DEB